MDTGILLINLSGMGIIPTVIFITTIRTGPIPDSLTTPFI